MRIKSIKLLLFFINEDIQNSSSSLLYPQSSMEEVSFFLYDYMRWGLRKSRT
jgi:hypothetical protein